MKIIEVYKDMLTKAKSEEERQGIIVQIQCIDPSYTEPQPVEKQELANEYEGMQLEELTEELAKVDKLLSFAKNKNNKDLVEARNLILSALKKLNLKDKEWIDCGFLNEKFYTDGNDAYFENGAVYTQSEANHLLNLDAESKQKVHLLKTLFDAKESDGKLPIKKINELIETDEVKYVYENGKLLKYHKQDGRVEIGLQLKSL